MEIKEILLSATVPYANQIDVNSDNTDVVVELSNGHKYIAPFFAYDNIGKLVKEHEVSGDYLNGKYFYVHNMILVRNCSEKNIKEVVEHLIEEGEFLLVFRQLTV